MNSHLIKKPVCECIPHKNLNISQETASIKGMSNFKVSTEVFDIHIRFLIKTMANSLCGCEE